MIRRQVAAACGVLAVWAALGVDHLLTGMFVVITLIGAVAGLLSRKRPDPGIWIITSTGRAPDHDGVGV